MEDFKQRVQDLVLPGTSAILVILRKVTPDKFEEALRPYGGTVLRTSLRQAHQEQNDEAERDPVGTARCPGELREQRAHDGEAEDALVGERGVGVGSGGGIATPSVP